MDAEELRQRLTLIVAETPVHQCWTLSVVHILKLVEDVQKAAQANRKWVGLTEEELDEAMEYWSDDSRSTYGGARIADGEYVNMRDTWRYIEAKLKEKNT